MPDQEIIERLMRVETKLDMVLPHIEHVSDLKNDVRNIKKIVGFLGTLVTTLGLWAATYWGSHK